MGPWPISSPIVALRKRKRFFVRRSPVRRRTFGRDHPNVAYRLNNLAVLVGRDGRLDEAEKFMRQALAIFEARLGADHPNTVALNANLAGLLAQRGQASPAGSPKKRVREFACSAAAKSAARFGGLVIRDGREATDWELKPTHPLLVVPKFPVGPHGPPGMTRLDAVLQSAGKVFSRAVKAPTASPKLRRQPMRRIIPKGLGEGPSHEIRQSSGIHRSEKPSGGHGCRFQNQERRRRSARKSCSFYLQTGRMLNPKRFELTPGAFVYRFGSVSAGPQKVAKGGWWMERAQFDKLVNFANVWSITVGMAMRTLCLHSPEWSDATLLVRGRVSDPLLAWRGLANAVVHSGLGQRPIGQDANRKRNQRPSPPSALHSRRRRSRDLGPGNSGPTRNIRWTRAKA